MKSFDNNWEKLYSQTTSNHLNKYPFGDLVSYFFRFKKNNERLSNGTGRCLEVGCGAGNNLPVFANEGLDTYGVDGSKSVIDIAKERFANYSNIHLDVADFLNLPFKDKFFDLVIDREAIYANRFTDIKNIFLEVSRVLAPEGLFISFCYSRDHRSYLSAVTEGTALQVDDGTFTNFKNDSFKGTGNVHFFSLDTIFSFAKKSSLEVIYVAKKSIQEIFPRFEAGSSEYIVIYKKLA